MTLWRLELLRLWRTQRWLILLAVYGAFGMLGPLTARYLPELMESLGEDVVGTLPPMTPPDGITQYIGNAAQLGLLAVAFVGAAALTFDSKEEISIFLRTRASVREIFDPRFVLTAAAAALAFTAGMALAYVGTGVLLEWLDLGDIVVGSLLHILYLVFAVAVMGFYASLFRNVPAVALLSVGTMVVFVLISLVPTLAPWSPSELVGAIDGLVRGGEFDYWRSTVTTIVLTAVLYLFAVRRLEGREV